MRFLYATGRSHLPDPGGGAERSIDSLLQLLHRKGHTCEAVVGLNRGWRRKIVRRIHFFSAGRRLRLSDWHNGYQTHRTAPWLVARLTRQRLGFFQPDIVITQLERSDEIVAVALGHGVRVVLMVRDAQFDWWPWPALHPHIGLISNSEFIASRARDQMGIESTVIYPVIRWESYKVSYRVPEFITFVNPVPEKGVELALEIAALVPNRRFLLVESWPVGEKARRRLRDGLKQLPNVTFAGWTHDMRTVYSRTALLIVPSQWEEAFGRVALEAQVSGIPVVARDIGGLGEVLRDSGILLPQNAAADAWVQTIERLLSDQSFYAACSTAASINASRPEFNPLHQVDRFLAIATERISK